MKEKEFLSKLGLGSDNTNLWCEKLFIGGQAMGGFTSILCAAQCPEIFTATLSHDAVLAFAGNDIMTDKLQVTVPTYTL